MNVNRQNQKIFHRVFPPLEQFVINIMECGALGKMDIIISDASAVLRNLPWPGTGGLVSDFI